MAPIHLLTFLICVRGWVDVFLDTLLTLVQQKRKALSFHLFHSSLIVYLEKLFTL